MEDLFEKANSLIKEATNYKKSDIIKAISLIEEAIKIKPETNYNDYFKLASYYQLSGDTNNAYIVFGKLTGKLNYNNVLSFNNKVHQIFSEKAKILFNAKGWVDYLFSLCFALWNDLISIALNGWSKDLLSNLLEREDVLFYFPKNKINKAFKELNKEDQQGEFSNRLKVFIQSYSQLFLKTFEVSSYLKKRQTNMDDPFWEHHKLSDFFTNINEDESFFDENSYYKSDDKFNELYEKLNDIDFSGFFDEELAPLLSE